MPAQVNTTSIPRPFVNQSRRLDISRILPHGRRRPATDAAAIASLTKHIEKSRQAGIEQSRVRPCLHHAKLEPDQR